ncbi:MAG: glycosyltransferase, partial [Chloroflexi bacterium]|nr:glycosyltransferase [Chloroflexota bacterium]
MTSPISVALCTHNGERYLRAQLESIAAQSLLPAEVVACDDGSTDRTVDILESFAGEAPFPVRVARNARRFGPAKNYEQAIGRCSGDFIALADQDDMWLPAKLQRLTDAIEREGAAYAFSDARLIDADGRVVAGKTLLARRFAPARIERAFRDHRELDLLLKRDFIYGTTLMFRSEYRELVLPIGAAWSHDTWIVNVLALMGYSGAPVPYPERVLAYEALRAHIEDVSGRTGRRVTTGAMARLENKLCYLRALVE